MFEPETIFTREQYEDYYRERFIYTKELHDIVEIMRSHNNYRILILGSPGSGKSTLLRLISHYTPGKNPIEIVRGYAIRDNNYDLLNQKGTPLLIDGLDETNNLVDLLGFINKQNYDKLICTSRFTIPMDTYFTHVVTIKPLTQNQMVAFVKMLGINDKEFSSSLNNNILTTPKEVLSHIIANIDDSDVQDFYLKYGNLLYQYGNGVDFSSDIILPENKIIVPSKDVIKDVTIISESLLKKSIENPQIIHSFSPYEFEQMVCELLDKQGYNVKLTKQTRDGGKDIIIIQKSILGEFCIYVECKKYDVSRPISVGFVRELYGTVMVDNATAGMIITTSHFTKDAKEYTEKIKHRMTLKNYNDLVQELNSIKY